MAGWTTLRVAHAPTHRPSAAHKLHRTPPREMEKYKQYPARRSGIAGPPTSAKEAANQPVRTRSYNLNRATQHRTPDRSRSRNHRSRSPKCARGLLERASVACWPGAGGVLIPLLQSAVRASEARQAVGIGRGAVGKPRTPQGPSTGLSCGRVACPRRARVAWTGSRGVGPAGPLLRVCLSDQGACSGAVGVQRDARGRLLEAIALALELQHGRAVHETVEDGGGHGGVAEVLAPVLHDTV